MNHEQVITNILGASIQEPITGGVSNVNYKVTSLADGAKPKFITLYPTRDTWWKVGKELKIATLLDSSTIPTAEIFDSGIQQVDSERVAFVVREFINGENFDTVMSESQKLDEKSWDILLGQLGTTLGIMHSIPMPAYGLIRKRTIAGSETRRSPATNTWETFVDVNMTEKDLILNSVASDVRIGSIYINDIRSAFSQAKQHYLQNKHALQTVDMPFLTHNDMRFANCMATMDSTSSRWRLGALVDFEWALAGDPDVDLVQIENWLQFAPYKDRFESHKDAFLSAYQEKRDIPDNYPSKRRIYHMLRSLSYLTMAFSRPDQAEFSASEQNVLNVAKHFDLLQTAIDIKKPIDEVF